MHISISKRSLAIAAVALFATLALQLLLVNPAHAATVTWDGEAGDSDLATATNWVDDVAPMDGDTLVFDSNVYDYSNYDTVLDNTTLTTIAGITMQGANDGSVEINGNDLTLTGNIVDSATGSMRVALDLNVTLGADLSSVANFSDTSGITVLNLSTFTLTIPADAVASVASTISGTGGIVSEGITILQAENTYTGPTQVGASGMMAIDHVSSLGDSSGSTTLATGAQLCVQTTSYPTEDIDISEDITIAGGATGPDINVSPSCFMGSAIELAGVLTFSGTITLNGDAVILNTTKNVVFSDLVDNGNELSQSASSTGSLTIGTELQAPPAEEVVTVDEGDDDAAQSVTVGNNTKYIINGVRGSVWVMQGGTLNGTGTVGVLTVFEGGTLAPGLSPGCLTTGDLILAGDFDVEIDGATVCSQYDQTDVTGTVNVTGGTLNILKLASYDPTDGGATFIIIKNDDTDAVVGTFTGLVEGATTTVDGVEYTISYEGGDGNDVTLTVAAAEVAPDAPDTGFGLQNVNSTLVIIFTAFATAGMVFAARKLQALKA